MGDLFNHYCMHTRLGCRKLLGTNDIKPLINDQKMPRVVTIFDYLSLKPALPSQFKCGRPPRCNQFLSQCKRGVIQLQLLICQSNFLVPVWAPHFFTTKKTFCAYVQKFSREEGAHCCFFKLQKNCSLWNLFICTTHNGFPLNFLGEDFILWSNMIFLFFFVTPSLHLIPPCQMIKNGFSVM